jgi:hypothetical protein
MLVGASKCKVGMEYPYMPSPRLLTRLSRLDSPHLHHSSDSDTITLTQIYGRYENVP